MTGRHGLASDQWYGYCRTCGKHRFPSRRVAKQAARLLYPGEALRAYACGDSWHIGHTPRWKLRGKGEWG